MIEHYLTDLTWLRSGDVLPELREIGVWNLLMRFAANPNDGDLGILFYMSTLGHIAAVSLKRWNSAQHTWMSWKTSGWEGADD